MRERGDMDMWECDNCGRIYTLVPDVCVCAKNKKKKKKNRMSKKDCITTEGNK